MALAGKKTTEGNLAKSISGRFAVLGGVELPETAREPIRSRLLREHSERFVEVEEEIIEHRRASAKYQERTDQNLAEITDKLNGLIGYMDGQKRP